MGIPQVRMEPLLTALQPALKVPISASQPPDPATEQASTLTVPGIAVETVQPPVVDKESTSVHLEEVAHVLPSAGAPAISEQSASGSMPLSTAPDSISQLSQSLPSMIKESSPADDKLLVEPLPLVARDSPPSTLDTVSVAVGSANSDDNCSPKPKSTTLDAPSSLFESATPPPIEPETGPSAVVASSLSTEPLPIDSTVDTLDLGSSVHTDVILEPVQCLQEGECFTAPESHVESMPSTVTGAGLPISVEQDLECGSTIAPDSVTNNVLPSTGADPCSFDEIQPCSLDAESFPDAVPSAVITDVSPGMAVQAFEPSLTTEAKGVANDSSCADQARVSPTAPIGQIPATQLKPLLSGLDAAGTFDNNLVSSVDGEAVLIVEGLGVPSSGCKKTVGDLPGTADKSEATGQQKEEERDGNLELLHAQGKSLLGQKVRKKFGRKHFEGEIISFDPELNWYKVIYEDGDEEELELAEVKRLFIHPSSEEEPSAKRRRAKKHRKIGTPMSLWKAGDEATVVEVSEEDYQTQEKLKFRGLQKRNVIDTSNEMGAESFDDEAQFSYSTDQTSEVSHDESAVEKRVGLQRKVRRKKRRAAEFSRFGKRRKSGEKSGTEDELVVSEARLRSKQKADLPLKSQETPAEHRITTRSSTGALHTHIVSPFDGQSSPGLKKDDEDFQSNVQLESPTLHVLSPLGGGVKMIGRRTRKDFGGQVYNGEVVGYDSRAKYYKVRYEDGDEEELEWDELKPTILPQDEQQQVLALEAPYQVVRRFSKRRLKEHSRRIRTPKDKQGALILYDGTASNGDLPSPARRWRKKVRTASVSVMMKGTEDWAAAPSTPPMTASRSPPHPLAVARFASASDADIFEYFGWGEVVHFDKSKCPELRAANLLPTSSPVVHLAASRHHLAAITAAGQVWVWRSKHGNIHTRCGEWEHISALEERNVVLVDISGPDLDRTSAGYEAEQEDQVPDPFYLAAVCRNGEDIILQGSQPHESVHTYQYDSEPHYSGLRDALLRSDLDSCEGVGRIVQVSVGMVEAPDESPFVGYITDSDRVYMRSATRDYMEEVNLVTGYTGKPIKIQCGRVYHAIIMTDDGRAWTWGQGYYPGSNSISSNFSSKWSSPFSVCQPAVGTLVGRKVVDVGCYGEDFIALTSDGDVHQWTHAVPNPAAGVYNVPATPIYSQGPSIGSGDKLKQVSIGAGMCAGISECGKVHTWRTSMKGGFVGVIGSEREAQTPLGHDEGYKETVIFSLGARFATRVMCVAGSLIVVVKRKSKSRRGGKRKSDVTLKGKAMGHKVISG